MIGFNGSERDRQQHQLRRAAALRPCCLQLRLPPQSLRLPSIVPRRKMSRMRRIRRAEPMPRTPSDGLHALAGMHCIAVVSFGLCLEHLLRQAGIQGLSWPQQPLYQLPNCNKTDPSILAGHSFLLPLHKLHVAWHQYLTNDMLNYTPTKLKVQIVKMERLNQYEP